jgi:hypothetical protein
LRFRNDADLSNGIYNPNRPLRVLIHGWWEDDTSDISTATAEQLLNFYDFNM